MKIVFVNRFYHPDQSATSQLLTDLCEHLARGGREVCVVTSRKRHDDPSARLPPRETLEGVQVDRIWTTRFGRMSLPGRSLDYLSFYLSAAWRLARNVRTGDVVVAETDPPLISVVAACVCRLRGAALVNWVQDVFPEVAQRLGFRAADGTSGALLRWMRDFSLRAATTNVALGELMATYLRRCAPATPAVVLHNWSDGRAVRPVPVDRNELRRQWGLGPRLVVGYSGNMGRAHDFETFLDACARITRDDVAFVLIGCGQQRAHVESEVARRGARNVSFHTLQPRERLAESLSVADAHIVTLKPSLEGLVVPSKFYGIAAAGRAVIFVGAPDGELARLVRMHECGIVVESGHGLELAAAIERLADDPPQAARMGQRARAAFEAMFDMPIALAQWEAVIAAASQRETMVASPRSALADPAARDP